MASDILLTISLERPNIAICILLTSLIDLPFRTRLGELFSPSSTNTLVELNRVCLLASLELLSTLITTVGYNSCSRLLILLMIVG